MSHTAVEMTHITKVFPGMYRAVVANDKVDLRVQEGEIHVIVGENGAGKSTLMNILYGLLAPDSGEIVLFGKPVAIANPKMAIDLGIGMIHQHFMLIPSFTVGENIVLGDEITKGALLDRRKIRDRVKTLSRELMLDVDPDTPVWDTSVGVQQRVEILKALYRDARILVLDEPTAVLTPQEVDVLFDALRKLSVKGTTIIMITHKLREVMQIADHVTVLRDGAVVGCVSSADLNEGVLAEMMTGRAWFGDRLPRDPIAAAPQAVLEVVDLCCRDDRGLLAVNGVTFTAYAGEILSIAGVAHNGQEELAEAIMGQRPLAAGHVRFLGKDIRASSVRAIRSLGISHIPDDRYGEGCAREASVSKNMIMGLHFKPPLGNRLYVKQRAVKQKVADLIDEYDIRLDHPDVPIMSLSGGNVQKAIVAREISSSSRFLIAEQPSRGIDIGASEQIYERLISLRNKGVGILLISMDLTEVMRISDRILVIYNGRIVGERLPAETDQKGLGLLMAGAGHY